MVFLCSYVIVPCLKPERFPIWGVWPVINKCTVVNALLGRLLWQNSDDANCHATFYDHCGWTSNLPGRRSDYSKLEGRGQKIRLCLPFRHVLHVQLTGWTTYCVIRQIGDVICKTYFMVKQPRCCWCHMMTISRFLCNQQNLTVYVKNTQQQCDVINYTG